MKRSHRQRILAVAALLDRMAAWLRKYCRDRTPKRPRVKA